MKLLIITAMGVFPRDVSPMAGIFFANLVVRLQRLADKLVCVVPGTYIPAPLKRLRWFARHRGYRQHERRMGLEVYRPAFPSIHSEKHMWVQARSFCWAARPICEHLHARHGFDAILAHDLSMAGHAAGAIGKALGLPSACYAIGADVHTLPNYSRENLRQLRHIVRHLDVVLTNSEDLKQMILSLCPGARNVHPHYMGIELSAYRQLGDREAIRRRLGLRPDRRYMLMAGRVIVPKGSEEFYEAFRRLAADRPELHALWVGDGPEAPRLRTRADSDGLSDRLTITGMVTREEVLQYMQAADVMAFSSHAEGLPNVVMEALVCRLPTVATDVGGCREVVADRITGRLVGAKNAPELSKAVAWVLDRPADAARMAARGRQLILDHLDVDKNAPVVLDILRHLADGASPDQPVRACAGVRPGQLPVEALGNGQ